MTLFCLFSVCDQFFSDDYRRLGRNKPPKETRFFADDGRILNINQGKYVLETRDEQVA